MDSIDQEINSAKGEYSLAIPVIYLNRSSRLQAELAHRSENQLTSRYQNLKQVNELQKRTVRHCIHKVKSPVSAISGYLELLQSSLSSGHGEENIERYSRKIAAGLSEVGFLLEQLHEMHRLDSEWEEDGALPDVNLNWLAAEVAEIFNSSADLNAGRVHLKSPEKPVFIQTDLFQIKLIIYNMVRGADLFTDGECNIELETGVLNKRAVLRATCTGDFSTDEELIRSLNPDSGSGEPVTERDRNRDAAINGLWISRQMASQAGGEISFPSMDDRQPTLTFSAPLSTAVNL